MSLRAGPILIVTLAAQMLLACALPSQSPPESGSSHDELIVSGKPPAAKVTTDNREKGVAGLPFARGRSFQTLDGYLAFLKEMSAVDIPWYEEVSPGRYRLNRGLGDRYSEPEFFTRAELAAKYGFIE